jgi:uncharacterized protein
MNESAVSFERGGTLLHGVLHVPGEGKGGGIGVVFLHGWSGCRLGPHRMFVKLSRQLCGAGYHCLRFDFAGRGESGGAVAEASINTMIEDAKAAMAFLAERSGVARTVLLGICSGSKVAMGVAATAGGVDGLVLLSHEAMGELRRGGDTDARKSRSVLKAYLLKLMRPETWRKILTGRVNTRMVGKALAQSESPDDAELVTETGWHRRLQDYPGRMLFIYGSNDPATPAAQPKYAAFCRKNDLKAVFHVVDGANHSFYSLAWEGEVCGAVREWLSVSR